MQQSRSMRFSPPPAATARGGDHGWTVPLSDRSFTQSGAAILIALFMLSLVPIWISLLKIAGGNLKPFHLLGFALVGWCVVTGLLWRRLPTLVSGFPLLHLGFALYLGAMLTAFGLHLEPYFSKTEILRQCVYIPFTLVVAVVCLSAQAPALRWSAILAGLAAPLLFSALTTVSLLADGTSPLAIVRDALTTGNTNLLIYRLFRSSFVGLSGQEEVQANIRHNVFAALVTISFLGAAYATRALRPGSPAALLFYGCLALTVLLTLLSLSRSMMLSLVVVGGVALLAAFLNGRIAAVLFAPALAVLALIGVVVSGFAGVLVERFFENTGSYMGRLDALRVALDDIVENPLFGADKLGDVVTAHNVFIDAWRGAGVFAALGALIWGAVLVRCWFDVIAFALWNRARWRLPIDPVPLVGLATLPLVRYVTSGGGLLSMGEFLPFGIVVGLLAANTIAGRAPTDPAATAVPAGSAQRTPIGRRWRPDGPPGRQRADGSPARFARVDDAPLKRRSRSPTPSVR